MDILELFQALTSDDPDTLEAADQAMRQVYEDVFGYEDEERFPTLEKLMLELGHYVRERRRRILDGPRG